MSLLADNQDPFGGTRAVRVPDWASDRLVSDVDASGFDIDHVSINGAINIKAYGAEGDNVTDDTDSILAAIAVAKASRKAVYVPAGTYRITATLLFTATADYDFALGMVGDGPDSIIISSADIPLITVDTSDGRMDYVHFCNLRLVNDGSGTNDIGILLTEDVPIANGLNNCLFSNLDFHEISYGIRNTRSYQGSAEGGLNWCKFTNLNFWYNGPRPTKYCILFDYGGGGTGNVFSNMTMVATEACISMGDGTVQNVGDILFSGLHMAGDNVSTIGIKLVGPSYHYQISIVNCQMDAGVVSAFDFTNMAAFSILGVNGAVGGTFTDCADFIIDQPGHCTFTNCSNYIAFGYRDQSGSPILGINGRGISSDGWSQVFGETWTYASPTTFTVAGDVSTAYQKGDKIKLTQTSVKYFVVAATSVFSAGVTTVTVTGGSDYTLANAAISSQFVSRSLVPEGFPLFFTYSPSFSASGSMTFTSITTNIARFVVQGGLVTVFLNASGTTGGTASNNLRASLPITPNDVADHYRGGATYAEAGDIMAGIYNINADGVNVRKADSSNYTLGASREMAAVVQYMF